MYEHLGEVKLKTGETAHLGAVLAPDAEWRERLEELLGHKRGIWNWQNSTLLATEVGIKTRYYVLHREGVPFANVMLVELAGAGIFGHVWTCVEDRRKGASSLVIGGLMEAFRTRGGEALFLGTGYGSVPYRLYERFGFRGVEPGSGCMAYYAHSREEFEAAYFAQGRAVVEDAGWRHWPASPALFLGDFPGVVRCAPLGLLGRASTEGPLLEILRDAASSGEGPTRPRAVAARLEGTQAVVGLAAWGWDPLWPGICIVDVYCHPAHWDRAAELLSRLPLPEARRCVAFADSDCEAKIAYLREAGFRPAVKLDSWMSADAAKTRSVDVQLFTKK